jgi:DNA-directed RNA polymerase II subunit RPB1
MDPSNAFIATVTSGSRGDFFNIAQIGGILGQQNLTGQRIQPVLNKGKRTLPHYKFGELDVEKEYESKGFIRHSFMKGLNPREFFLHAMSGRESVSDTAMKTAQSGYIQRKMVKILEDVQVKYDGTVRNSTGSIIQWAYGEDGFDRSHTVIVNEKPEFCDIARLADKLNTEFEVKSL